MATIELRHVNRIFPGGVKAVDDLCITVGSGRFVSLLGPSGCGKTTTLRMIAGLDAPDSGEIFLDDKPLYSRDAGIVVPPEKRGMGLVFQSYALWPHMTVWQNVAFGLDMKGLDHAHRNKRVQEVLELMHIADLGPRYPAQLSGGQQQRVALARNLAVSPNVLLLDEPLSNLDAKLRLEMRTELKRLHDTLGNTIIYVTHDQLEAMTMSTEIAVMDRGKLQQFATPMEIYRKPANLTVAEFVGSPPMNIIKKPKTDEKYQDLSNSWDLGLLASFPNEAPKVQTIGIRPEDIKLVAPGSNGESRSGNGRWLARAKVNTILPTGSEWVVGLEIEGMGLYALTHEEPCCLGDGQIDMLVSRSSIHLFDDRGSRIGRGE